MHRLSGGIRAPLHLKLFFLFDPLSLNRIGHRLKLCEGAGRGASVGLMLKRIDGIRLDVPPETPWCRPLHDRAFRCEDGRHSDVSCFRPLIAWKDARVIFRRANMKIASPTTGHARASNALASVDENGIRPYRTAPASPERETFEG
ncbi:hypothetical protein [Rhodovulum steppense]|uniref:hypothetical protein n=1 Tax=Rhodovulum steppense TaxID=540251 RepID=UPI00140456B8|nr:hypothetical protein [Rhodovulum steppense]